MNFRHKCDLIAAELARIQGEDWRAAGLYETAIAGARKNGFFQEEALANELAAKFYLAHGREEYARLHLNEAQRGYGRWQAFTKVRVMKAEYPQWLKRVDSKPPAPETHALDTESILKATHAISGEIEIGRVLGKIMRIIIENAGAQIGFLLMESNGAWTVAARGEIGRTEVEIPIPEAVDDSDAVSAGVIHFVARTRKTVVLDDAATRGAFVDDPHIRREKTRSLLAIPLSNRGRLLGILYLVNNLSTHAFTQKRIRLLEMLAAQAAISLETAGAYEALRLNELRYRLGQTAAHIGTWEYDLRTDRFWGSDEAKRIYGFDADAVDFSAENVGYCIPERQRMRQSLLDLIDREVPYNLEFEIRPENGSAPKFISSIAELHRDLHGKPKKVVGVIQDITERVQAEAEIRLLNQELEQRVADRTAKLEAANKELEAFAYSVSHDLRAPLRHIDGFLELLQKKAAAALDEQSRHYMDTIADAARKMGLLIDDLLSFSRMGRHALSFQPVNLGSLVRDVIGELEPDAAGREIAWRIHDLPAVDGDATMLRMVLANLIANALKFTRPCRQAQIEIGSIPGQLSEAVIFLRDNGVGFDMTYADKLFGVFQRLHRSEEFEGTGIGLANVRRIIARHGGRTWAEGKVNQGAAFYFSLPRAKHVGGVLDSLSAV